jgi:hypothetical protein
MTVLKLALFGSLRIAILGSLKIALFVYALFLSDTSFGVPLPKAMAMLAIMLPNATESGGNGNANIGEAGPMPRAARAGKRLEFAFFGDQKT